MTVIKAGAKQHSVPFAFTSRVVFLLKRVKITGSAKRPVSSQFFELVGEARLSREEWHPEQRGRWLDGGLYELEVPYANETEIVMDILRQGEQVKVCSPASLAKAVTARLAAASAQYA